MIQKFVIFFVTTLVLSSSLFADIKEFNYYPKTLLELKSKAQIGPPQEKLQGKLRELLYRTVSQVHLRTPASRDTLHSTCPESRLENQKCLKQRRDISYKQARRYLFGELHLKRNFSGHYVMDKYCQRKVGEYDGVGPGEIPDHTVMNCEHTWPQSKFNRRHSRNLQKTDLHHLYPVYSRANSSRGNLPFAEVRDGGYSLCEASNRGPALNTGTTSFEPPDEHKGNVARALFYFSLRYEIEITEGEEEYLRKWHQLDPVDENERRRNQRIYEIQGNRNPFIDDAQLITLIEDF